MRLHPRQLEALRAIVLTGSVSAAAQRLSVTQPAVSRLIADLEEAVGFLLFDRSNRRLHLRPEGRQLYEEVERSFIGLEKISQRALQIRDHISGELRIACMPAASLGLLPQAIQMLLQRYPRITITVDVGDSHKVAEWTATLQFDLGLAAFPINQRGVTLHQVIKLPCVCAMPSDHALTAMTVIQPAMLAHQRFVSLGRDSDLRRDIDQVFEAHGVERDLAIETSTSSNAMQMVRLGIGVTIVDPFTAAALASHVAIRPFHPPVDYAYAVLVPDRGSQSRLTTEFIQILHDAAHAYTGVVSTVRSRA